MKQLVVLDVDDVLLHCFPYIQLEAKLDKGVELTGEEWDLSIPLGTDKEGLYQWMKERNILIKRTLKSEAKQYISTLKYTYPYAKIIALSHAGWDIMGETITKVQLAILSLDEVNVIHPKQSKKQWLKEHYKGWDVLCFIDDNYNTLRDIKDEWKECQCICVSQPWNEKFKEDKEIKWL